MRNFFTAKNLWQQDITFKERTKAGMKTAGMIGITAWLYYRRVWAVIFLILPGIWLYREFLEEFAERVPSEDVKSFVTVFVTAKKSGGDMIGIIRNTTSQIGDKIEVKREIDTLLAAKKYEFQIMSMVPYGIIAYMSLSFSNFMEELYGNVTGIGVMTLCLGIYVGAYYLGVRILRIDV